MDWYLFARSLRRRRAWIAVAAAIAFAATAIALQVEDRYYVAKSTIALNQNGSIDGVSQAFNSTAAADRSVDNVLLLANSDDVAAAAAKLLHTSNVASLRHDTTASQVSNTDAIRFSVHSQTALQAQREANAWARALELTREQSLRDGVAAAVAGMQAQLSTIHKQINAADRQLANNPADTSAQSERDVLQKQANALTNRQQQVLAAAAVPNSTADVVLLAHLPSRPGNPNPWTWAIAAALAAAFLAAAIGAGVDALTPERPRRMSRPTGDGVNPQRPAASVPTDAFATNDAAPRRRSTIVEPR